MKTAVPALIAGPTLGAAIFLFLRMLAPAGGARTGDPWADYLSGLGFDAHLTSVSVKRKPVLQILAREFSDPAFIGTVIRVLEVDRAKVQIIEFTGEDAAARVIPERGPHIVPHKTLVGHLSFRVCRSGRHAVVIPPVGMEFGRRHSNIGASFAARIFEAFQERVEHLP